MLFVAAVPAFAQQASAAAPTPPDWTLTPYFAVSFDSPVGVRWGLTPDRRHFFGGVHATYMLVNRPRWSFRYAPELLPLLIITNNPKYRAERVIIADVGSDLREVEGEGLLIIEDGTGPVAGFGFSPIGFEARSRLSQRLEAYGSGSLGGVWFTREVPILNSRLFNFTAEFGAGLVWHAKPELGLRAGYKFFHLSNGQTAPENPGIDGHVVLVGFERSF